MGSRLEPSLANASLVHHEQERLDSCPLDYGVLYYRRYFDDIFVLFKLCDLVKRFHIYYKFLSC